MMNENDTKEAASAAFFVYLSPNPWSHCGLEP